MNRMCCKPNNPDFPSANTAVAPSCSLPVDLPGMAGDSEAKLYQTNTNTYRNFPHFKTKRDEVTEKINQFAQSPSTVVAPTPFTVICSGRCKCFATMRSQTLQCSCYLAIKLRREIILKVYLPIN